MNGPLPEVNHAKNQTTSLKLGLTSFVLFLIVSAGQYSTIQNYPVLFHLIHVQVLDPVASELHFHHFLPMTKGAPMGGATSLRGVGTPLTHASDPELL